MKHSSRNQQCRLYYELDQKIQKLKELKEMATLNLDSIEAGDVKLTFSVEHHNGQLLRITAKDANNNVYDASLKMVPRDQNLSLWCCTSTPEGTICTSGPC